MTGAGPGLSLDEVRASLAALGLPIAEDDLADVTFRVNATFEILRSLDTEPLPWGPPGAYLNIDGVPGFVASSPPSAPPAPLVSRASPGASEALLFLSAVELGDLIGRHQVSSEETVRAFLDRIDRLNPALNAFITVCPEAALAAARRADRELARGESRGPLHGVPFAVKDQFWTDGVRTTNGSRLFTDFVPDEDATAVARLRAAGAVLLGKLNMMELGFGPTATPPFGMPKNPWDLARTPGGSSSGPASAVAAALCPVTLGADAGGSVRLPAAFCGVVGLKPTWGRVSRYGLIGMCAELDCAGPLAAAVADCAAMLSVIAGTDRRDPDASSAPVDDYARRLGMGVRGTRIGVVRELMASPAVQPDVRSLVEAALTELEKAGARVEEVSIPLIARSSALYIAVAEPSAAALYRTYLQSRAGDIDPLPRRRLLAASLISAASSVRARQLRQRLRSEVDEALGAVDVLISPTTSTVAPLLAAVTAIRSKAEAWDTVLAGRAAFTHPFSLTGHPALSVPCGFTAAGLPAGFQLAGRAFAEGDILRIGHAYQSVTEWRRHP